MNSECAFSDNTFMAQALRLAEQGRYTTHPNPRVGCVLVKAQEVIGQGFHYRAGEGHAEVRALQDARAKGHNPQGATAYVTLEPCSHYGRTPPCARALIDAQVSRVVCAMQDPNPQVAGQGIAMLQQAGVATEVGVLQAQARLLNRGFIKRMEQGLPWVRIKLAMSLDGRTAMQSGESQWITAPAARADVQRLRAESSVILTGVGSVLQDDSSLTVRPDELLLDNAVDVARQQPLRVLLDTHAQTPSSAKIFHQNGRTLWVGGSSAMLPDVEPLSPVLDVQGRIDLHWLLTYLARQEQCNELLVEAGATLAGAFVAAGLYDELVVYMAATLLGSSARPLLSLPFDSMQQQQRLQLLDVRQIGPDLRLTYAPQRSCH